LRRALLTFSRLRAGTAESEAIDEALANVVAAQGRCRWPQVWGMGIRIG
jgi:hypothetical protein